MQNSDIELVLHEILCGKNRLFEALAGTGHQTYLN
jgi:hypothetical protein